MADVVLDEPTLDAPELEPDALEEVPEELLSPLAEAPDAVEPELPEDADSDPELDVPDALLADGVEDAPVPAPLALDEPEPVLPELLALGVDDDAEDDAVPVVDPLVWCDDGVEDDGVDAAEPVLELPYEDEPLEPVLELP